MKNILKSRQMQYLPYNLKKLNKFIFYRFCIKVFFTVKFSLFFNYFLKKGFYFENK